MKQLKSDFEANTKDGTRLERIPKQKRKRFKDTKRVSKVRKFV